MRYDLRRRARKAVPGGAPRGEVGELAAIEVRDALVGIGAVAVGGGVVGVAVSPSVAPDAELDVPVSAWFSAKPRLSIAMTTKALPPAKADNFLNRSYRNIKHL